MQRRACRRFSQRLAGTSEILGRRLVLLVSKFYGVPTGRLKRSVTTFRTTTPACRELRFDHFTTLWTHPDQLGVDRLPVLHQLIDLVPRLDRIRIVDDPNRWGCRGSKWN